MLRRPAERLEGLAELNALTEAMGEPHLEFDVMLRRAAALRSANDDDRAAEIARKVAELAASRGDTGIELAAQLELGQALLRTPIGEGYNPNPTESDFDGGSKAYLRALELATELKDDRSIAAAERELGVIATGRVRAYFIELDHDVAHGGVQQQLRSSHGRIAGRRRHRLRHRRVLSRRRRGRGTLRFLR